MRFKRIAKPGNYQEYLSFYSAATKKENLLVSSCQSPSLNEVLMSRWDNLKNILNQEQFYLLQASKNSTQPVCFVAGL